MCSTQTLLFTPIQYPTSPAFSHCSLIILFPCMTKKKPWNPAGMHFCLYNNEIKQFKKTRMLGCVLWIHFMFMRAEKLWDWVCVINVSIMLLTNVNTIKHSSATSSPWLKATTIKVWKNKYTQPFIIYSWHFITHKIYNYYIIFQQHISCSVFLNVIQYTD